ncbi:MAG: M15 family metallopeptidase [Cyclobacteriaceae bacterium]
MAFEITPLSESRKQSILSNSPILLDAPVGLDRLRAVHFLHTNFEGGISQGEMIVLDLLSDSVLAIFKALHALQFPIEKAIPVDEFGSDDVASMEANNSSAFNSRRIMNTDRWSSHAYGAAIDINPRQNPYVPNPVQTDFKVYPSGGGPFLDRENVRKGMVEPIVSVFKKHGFTEWGGNWKSPLDYHHFQVDWERILRL